MSKKSRNKNRRRSSNVRLDKVKEDSNKIGEYIRERAIKIVAKYFAMISEPLGLTTDNFIAMANGKEFPFFKITGIPNVKKTYFHPNNLFLDIATINERGETPLIFDSRLDDEEYRKNKEYSVVRNNSSNFIKMITEIEGI